MIKVLQTISHSGDGIKNEDKLWHGPRDVLVLDGSTSLAPSSLDATWFVDRFSCLYADAVTATGDICSAINQTLETLLAEFRQAVEDTNLSEPMFFPSASGLFFHVNETELKIVTIGDCSADIYFKNGSQPMCIYDPQVSGYDNRVFASMKDLRAATGRDICDLVKEPAIRSMLEQNRRSMNTASGYRILSFGMTPCTPDEIITLPKDSIHHIVAYTDGFEDVAHLLADEAFTLSQACQILRRDEARDHLLNDKVRFKVHDDASAIVFES